MRREERAAETQRAVEAALVQGPPLEHEPTEPIELPAVLGTGVGDKATSAPTTRVEK
jgi:hypothetical protein